MPLATQLRIARALVMTVVWVLLTVPITLLATSVPPRLLTVSDMLLDPRLTIPMFLATVLGPSKVLQMEPLMCPIIEASIPFGRRRPRPELMLTDRTFLLVVVRRMLTLALFVVVQTMLVFRDARVWVSLLFPIGLP